MTGCPGAIRSGSRRAEQCQPVAAASQDGADRHFHFGSVLERVRKRPELGVAIDVQGDRLGSQDHPARQREPRLVGLRRGLSSATRRSSASVIATCVQSSGRLESASKNRSGVLPPDTTSRAAPRSAMAAPSRAAVHSASSSARVAVGKVAPLELNPHRDIPHSRFVRRVRSTPPKRLVPRCRPRKVSAAPATGSRLRVSDQ